MSENSKSPVLVVDNTWVDGMRTCPRYAQLRFEEHLVPALTAAPLNFGASIHGGFAEIGRKDAAGIKDMQLILADAQKETIAHYGLQEQTEGEWRTLDKAKDVILAYVARTDQRLAPIVVNGKPLIEIEFALPADWIKPETKQLLTDCGFDSTLIYAGILDRIVEYAGRVYVGDYKTVSKLIGDKRKGQDKSISPLWWKSFKPHGASPGYVWAAQHYFAQQVHGVLIDGIGVLKDDICFGRMTFEWTAAEIEEWKLDTEAWVCDYLRSKKAGFFRRNPKSCYKYNRLCQYHQLCSLPAGAREPMKKLYNISVWDPLTARKRARGEGEPE